MNDLDDLLAPVPAPDDPARKEAIFRATLPRLTRRLRIRRWLGYAAMLAIGAAGGFFAKPTAPPEVVTVTVEVPVLVPVPAAVPVPVPESPGVEVAKSGTQLELDAEQADDRAACAKLYRAAGDRFLAERDVSNAMRCYRLHLNEAGAAGRSADAADSWLLVQLKVSHTKENANATDPGT